jgi:putative ABC transport system permease protein
MNLLKISWSNLKFKPLNTALSIVLLAFGVGIISLMILLRDQLTEKFDRNIRDIDFVLAAKGSPLQSILANIYHVDAPTGNIKVSDAKKIIRNPMVEAVIPLAYGDNFEKFRIVGTTPKYPEHYGCVIEEGRMYSDPFEVTIGSLVARETGLQVGSTFTSTHGFDNAAEGDPDAHHHDKPFTVVGIFSQSDCVIDNLILTPVESTWLVHEHGHDDLAEDTQPDSAAMADPDAGREMTAYLIKKRNKGAFGMLSKLTEETTMQLANVAVENSRLMNNFGIGLTAVTAIAIVITILSFISIFISLFNSMKERKYELALMRTMGGTRLTLFTLILLEGIVLVVLGFASGILLSRIGLLVLSNTMKENFHYGLDKMGLTLTELLLFAITLLIGIVASLLPAVRALKMDISKTLANA